MLQRLGASPLSRRLGARAAGATSAGFRSSFEESDGRSLSSSSPSTSLPVVDCDPLLSGSSTRRERVDAARKLHEACRDVGFFYARADGITDATSQRRLLSLSRRWFEGTPLETKRGIALSPRTGYRGWQPLHANVTRYDAEGGGGKGYVGDHHEAIDLYRGVSTDDVAPRGALPPSPVHAPSGTGYPNGEFGRELSRELDRHVGKCLELGQAIMRGLSLALSLWGGGKNGETEGDELFFEREENGGTTAETSYWVTRVIHYPPMVRASADVDALFGRGSGSLPDDLGDVPADLALSCGEHRDYGNLTFISATGGSVESERALQVQARRRGPDGTEQFFWTSAPPLPGAFTCNIGDMLALASGGVYRSTPHRVVHCASAERGTPLPQPRTSVAFFYEPSFSTVVRPMWAGEGRGKEEAHYGKHLESKVLSNFEL